MNVINVRDQVLLQSWREMRPEEGRVQFGVIEDRLDEAAKTFEAELRGFFERVRDRVLERAVRLRKRGWAQLEGLTVRDSITGYRPWLKSYINDLYQFSKTLASKEIERTTPITTEAFQGWLNAKVQIVSRLHTALLDAKIRTSVLARERGEAVGDVIGRVFDDFAEKELQRGGHLLSVLALQAGRRDVFLANRDILNSLTWSAILDRRVCPVCAYLDGTTWAADDPTLLWPPIHWLCRCLLIMTPAGAAFQPTIQGLDAAWFDVPESYHRFGRLVGAYQGEL